MPAIVTVGSIGLDTIENKHGKVEDVLGGAASHFALAASHFADVGLIGAVGNDFPEKYRKLLADKGICMQGVEVRKGKTFRWSGVYSENMNQRTTKDVQLNVYQDYVPKVPREYRKTEILFLANIDPGTQLRVLEQVKDRALVGADTMNLWIDTRFDEVRELINHVDIIFLNEEEATQLTKLSDPVEAGRQLLAWGAGAVVVKMGSHGAVMLRREEVFFVPAYPVARVVDPTGAGDSFAGGFIGYLAREGWKHKDAFRRATVFGSIMGSANVEDFAANAVAGMRMDELERRYKNFREMTRF